MVTLNFITIKVFGNTLIILINWVSFLLVITVVGTVLWLTKIYRTRKLRYLKRQEALKNQIHG